MASRNFSLQKENDCKFQLRFVKYCTIVVTEGYHILLSQLNRLVRCYFIMFRMYIIRTSWEHNQRKRSVASVNGAGRSEPLRRGFRGRRPLRKFLGSKEYLDWFNDTGTLSGNDTGNDTGNLLKYNFGWSLPFSYV